MVKWSLNHVVRTHQDRLWNGNVQRSSCSQIDSQTKFARLLERKCCRRFSLQDSRDVNGRLLERVRNVRTESQQRSLIGELSGVGNCWQSISQCKITDLPSIREEHRASDNE